jgi:23S rRNA pseudouridine2605 synthase
MHRVQKLIAERSKYSRREAESLIEEGHVKVNGVKITLGDQAEDTDLIEVRGAILEPTNYKYYLLNKPKGYVTAAKDKFTKKVITELVPKNPRVYPVGRLDKDATGLLLLTNDGDFANNIAHPRYEIIKTYIATLKEPMTGKEAKQMESGIEIDGQKVSAKVIVLEPKTIAVQVHEGKHKIVKRLVKAVGSYVKKLHRTHIGNLAVDVPEGMFRELTEEDKKAIFAEPAITKKTFLD